MASSTKVDDDVGDCGACGDEEEEDAENFSSINIMENHSWEVISERVTKIYDEILEEKQ